MKSNGSMSSLSLSLSLTDARSAGSHPAAGPAGLEIRGVVKKNKILDATTKRKKKEKSPKKRAGNKRENDRVDDDNEKLLMDRAPVSTD